MVLGLFLFDDGLRRPPKSKLITTSEGSEQLFQLATSHVATLPTDARSAR
jgi:hypothetical protein